MEKILRPLTPRFEHVVAAIEEANDISTMTVRLLFGSLQAHEQQMNDNKIEKPIEQALQAQASIGRSYHKHRSSRGRGQERGGSYSSKGRSGKNHGGVKQNITGSDGDQAQEDMEANQQDQEEVEAQMDHPSSIIHHSSIFMSNSLLLPFFFVNSMS